MPLIRQPVRSLNGHDRHASSLRFSQAFGGDVLTMTPVQTRAEALADAAFCFRAAKQNVIVRTNPRPSGNVG